MPKGKKHSPEQIVAILRRIDSGEAVEAVCREINVSEATLYRWKQQYGGMEVDDVKELKNLREENARLKRIVADQVLNIQVLKEVNAKKW
jgi:putative transposase